MKVKIEEKILGVDGKTPLMNPESQSDLTLRDVCINSLLSPMEGDTEVTKYEKYELFKRIRTAKLEVEFKVEETAIIKKCIGKFQPPLILGQAFDLIEGK